MSQGEPWEAKITGLPAVNSASYSGPDMPCGCSSPSSSRARSTTLTTRTASCGGGWRHTWAVPVQGAGGAQPFDVLVDHRVDDVDERLVAGEQPVPAGQQVALQPALAGVFRQDLHDSAVRVQMFVDIQDLRLPCLAGGPVDG